MQNMPLQNLSNIEVDYKKNEMTDRRKSRRKRRPKVVPRAAADFVQQLKIIIGAL